MFKLNIVLVFLFINLNFASEFSWKNSNSICHQNPNMCIIRSNIRPDVNHDGTIIKIDCTKNVSEFKRFKFMKFIDWNGCNSSLPGLGLEYIDDPGSVLKLNVSQFENITLDDTLLKQFYKLQYLRFADNTVREIRGKIFRYGSNMIQLKIERNGLSMFSGADYFEKLSNLQQLTINEPSLEIVEHNFCFFNNLTNLEILSGSVIVNSAICKNHTSLISLKIHNICVMDDIQFCASLKYATTSKNIEISKTNLTIFRLSDTNFNNLLQLNISHNLIHNIELTLCSFNNLKTLDLSHNKISSLTINQFTNMVNVEVINLSFNQINTIDSNSFQNNVKIIQIDLKNNFLQNLDLDINNLKRLQTIHVDDNNWHCASLEKLLKNNSNLTKLFWYKKEMKYVNVNGLKCETIILSTTKSTDDVIITHVPITLIDEFDDSSYIIIMGVGIVSTIVIVVGFTKLGLYLYFRHKRSEFIPFYRRLTRQGERGSAATESTKSFMFRRRLPATQYETPINSIYCIEDHAMTARGGGDGTINNNMYEEISSFTTTSEDDIVPNSCKNDI